MSASESEWEFPLADGPEDVRAPRREDEQLDDPLYRPEMFVYEETGAVELRCAAGYLNTADYVDLSEWR